MAITTITEQTTRALEYVPCLKCGSTDVQFFDLGYTQGNTGGGKCRGCGNECKSAMHFNATKEQWVAAWNAQNDPARLIDAQLKIIQAAHYRIQEIRGLKAAQSALATCQGDSHQDGDAIACRELVDGSHVAELSVAAKLVLDTRSPEKWLAVDLETGEVWRGTVENGWKRHPGQHSSAVLALLAK